MFIATISFAGYLLVRSLLSAFPALSPISGLIWFGSVYLVTTAGFVADSVLKVSGLLYIFDKYKLCDWGRIEGRRRKARIDPPLYVVTKLVEHA